MEAKKPWQLWVEALRSGKYKQGTHTLEDRDGSYCCLGVACLVAEQHGVHVKRGNASPQLVGNTLGQQEEVAQWIGLRNDVGAFTDRMSYSDSLAGMNDEGVSFYDIADFIERNVDRVIVESKQ